MKTQLLATFTTKTDLDKTIEKIKGAYTIAFGKIYVLQNEKNDWKTKCYCKRYV